MHVNEVVILVPVGNIAGDATVCLSLRIDTEHTEAADGRARKYIHVSLIIMQNPRQNREGLKHGGFI